MCNMRCLGAGYKDASNPSPTSQRCLSYQVHLSTCRREINTAPVIESFNASVKLTDSFLMYNIFISKLLLTGQKSTVYLVYNGKVAYW